MISYLKAESKLELSHPLVVGNRRIVVASRRISLFIPSGQSALTAMVLPEFIFIEEAGSVYGTSLLTEVSGSLNDFLEHNPLLRQSVLDALSRGSPRERVSSSKESSAITFAEEDSSTVENGYLL